MQQQNTTSTSKHLVAFETRLLHWLFHTFPVEVWFLWFLYVPIWSQKYSYGRPSPGCRGTRRNATYRQFDDGSFQWCQCGCRRGSSDFNDLQRVWCVENLSLLSHGKTYPKSVNKKAKRHVGDDHIARCILSVESAVSFACSRGSAPVKFLQDSTKRMPTWAFFQACNGETKSGKATAGNISNAIPLRGTGLHEPQVDTIQMAGTGLWPTTLRATGSQHEEANYAALDPAIPKFFELMLRMVTFPMTWQDTDMVCFLRSYALHWSAGWRCPGIICPAFFNHFFLHKLFLT